jgi:predicted phosphodiesterase
MKVLVLSDLHLEFAPFHPRQSDENIVILAGDITTGHKGIPWARKTWPDKPIIYVPGNHEFYMQERELVLDKLRLAADECQVHLLDNDEVIIDGVRFLGATLWTDFCIFGNEDQFKFMEYARYWLNDFNLIRQGDKTFTPEDALALHKISREWLEMKLSREAFNGKTVVITHHAPSKLSVPKQYTNDALTPCFTSALDRLVELADFWIHGHMHESFDYRLGKCRVVCNPRGYCNYQPENRQFDALKLIDIS